MSIEVTDADVEAVEAIIAKSDSDRASNSWECVDPKEIIAAAWAVMKRKKDTQPCSRCNGTGACDSGGFTPWGSQIDVPCECAEKQQQRPWHQRSIELAELHGPYADFAAWQDWLNSQLKQSTHGVVCSVEEMDLESGSDIVFLYSAFCVAADQ